MKSTLISKENNEAKFTMELFMSERPLYRKIKELGIEEN